MEKTKRILVSGGSGYFGTRVVGQLLASGMHVDVLDCLHFGGEAVIDAGVPLDSIETG